MSLRYRIAKLAFENPELRPHILPHLVRRKEARAYPMSERGLQRILAMSDLRDISVEEIEPGQFFFSGREKGWSKSDPESPRYTGDFHIIDYAGDDHVHVSLYIEWPVENRRRRIFKQDIDFGPGEMQRAVAKASSELQYAIDTFV